MLYVKERYDNLWRIGRLSRLANVFVEKHAFCHNVDFRLFLLSFYLYGLIAIWALQVANKIW